MCPFHDFILIEHVICNVHALMTFFYCNVFMEKSTFNTQITRKNEISAESEQLIRNGANNNLNVHC